MANEQDENRNIECRSNIGRFFRSFTLEWDIPLTFAFERGNRENSILFLLRQIPPARSEAKLSAFGACAVDRPTDRPPACLICIWCSHIACMQILISFVRQFLFLFFLYYFYYFYEVSYGPFAEPRISLI